MAPRGTRIDGWWVWWPASGASYARVFQSEEDAFAYCPLGPSKVHGKAPPLGPKYMMRVSWDYDKSEWTNDTPVVVEQEQVWSNYFEGEAA